MNIFHEEKKEEHAVAPEEGKFSTAYLEHNVSCSFALLRRERRLIKPAARSRLGRWLSTVMPQLTSVVTLSLSSTRWRNASFAGRWVLSSLAVVLSLTLSLQIDLHVIPIISLLYLFCFIDRSNVGNARLAGLEEDLGMTGYDCAWSLGLFCSCQSRY